MLELATTTTLAAGDQAFSGLGWLSWIIVGILAGALAKLILPGKQGGGFLSTLIFGIIGAIVGGLIAGLIFPGDNAWGLWNPLMWVFSTLGAILVLLVWGFLTKKRGGTNTNHTPRV